MSPFEACTLYNSIKLHFTTNYDFFKYSGKSRTNFESFNRRRDKFHYAKLGKQKDPMGFLVANFISDTPPTWIGDLNTEEARERYMGYLARIQSLTYRFDTEIRRFDSSFTEQFKVKEGQHPNILVAFRQHDISIETFTILNDVLKFFPIWDRKIQDPVIWPSIRDKCLNYRPFLDYDRLKIKSIINDVLAESLPIYEAVKANTSNT